MMLLPPAVEQEKFGWLASPAILAPRLGLRTSSVTDFGMTMHLNPTGSKRGAY